MCGSDRASHLVQFFEDDEVLYQALTTFALPALTENGGVLLVVTATHRTFIEYHFSRAGLDVPGLQDSGQLRIMDASELLATFMNQTTPDAERFLDSVGAVVRKMESRFSRLLIYGEMVDLLWAANNRHGAFELESLWNDLGQLHEFTLLCGYQLSGFAGSEDALAFRQICAAHSHVLGGELTHKSDVQGPPLRFADGRLKPDRRHRRLSGGST